jgi:hypothetical protein
MMKVSMLPYVLNVESLILPLKVETRKARIFSASFVLGELICLTVMTMSKQIIRK